MAFDVSPVNPSVPVVLGFSAPPVDCPAVAMLVLHTFRAFYSFLILRYLRIVAAKHVDGIVFIGSNPHARLQGRHSARCASPDTGIKKTLKRKTLRQLRLADER
jgi:hypothetical protein